MHSQDGKKRRVQQRAHQEAAWCWHCSDAKSQIECAWKCSWLQWGWVSEERDWFWMPKGWVTRLTSNDLFETLHQMFGQMFKIDPQKSLDPWKCWLIPKECNNGSISGLLSSKAFTTNVRRTYEPVTGLENPLQPGQDEMELYLHIFRAGGDFAPSNILSLVNDPIGFSHCEPCRVGSPFSLLWFLVTLGKDPLAALPRDGPWQEVLWPGLEPWASEEDGDVRRCSNDLDNQFSHLDFRQHCIGARLEGICSSCFTKLLPAGSFRYPETQDNRSEEVIDGQRTFGDAGISMPICNGQPVANGIMIENSPFWAEMFWSQPIFLVFIPTKSWQLSFLGYNVLKLRTYVRWTIWGSATQHSPRWLGMGCILDVLGSQAS